MKVLYSGSRDELNAKLQQRDERIVELEAIIRDCQGILATHLPPDGPSAKFTVSRLLGILDGPRTRALIPKPPHSR